MWHYLIPAAGAIPCFAVWTYVAHHQNFMGISPITLYGLAFLGNLVSIAQPAALAYRSSTLYGASEQAVGGATAVAALSIASIIGPQVRTRLLHSETLSDSSLLQIFPEPDKPWYLPGFSAACATLTFTLFGFASLPLWLLFEARQRKKKTGHAMPLRALEDAQHAMVSDQVRQREHEQTVREEKGKVDVEATATRIERVGDTERKNGS